MRPIGLPALIALLAALAISACGEDEATSRPPTTGAPVRLLDGGRKAFERRLVRLRGTPVVVNQWASWCGPCRFEFPFFAEVARKYRGRVAFLGIDSQDNRKDAEKFLRTHPVPYDHFFDPDASIARVFRGGRGWPTTAFYDAAGKLEFTHQGSYRSADDLDAQIRRYALGG